MQQEQKRGGGVAALALVFVSAAGFAAALTALYRGMRDLMINSGGFCASGGPYAINPGQVCSTGQVWLLFGGVLAGLVFAGLLVFSSSRYSDGALAGVALLIWAALFGALGWNFISLGIDPPQDVSGGAGWIFSGVVFWLMALGGLIPGVMALTGSWREVGMPQRERSVFEEPLVRANASFVRSMPGDPAFGSSDPGSPPQAGTVQRTAGEQVFIDPVTGEARGGEDG